MIFPATSTSTAETANTRRRKSFFILRLSMSFSEIGVALSLSMKKFVRRLVTDLSFLCIDIRTKNKVWRKLNVYACVLTGRQQGPLPAHYGTASKPLFPTGNKSGVHLLE